jgi:predicted GIY-YIG superfamily endonuclease
MGATETKQQQQQVGEEVYVLELKGGYYYVGKSKNVDERFTQHVIGDGSSWTTLHEPLKILERKEIKTPFDEDNKTLEYMEKYGIDRVRGGSYTAVDLSATTIKEILKKLDTANNRCYKCHDSGHFASACTNSKKQQKIVIPNERPDGGACFRCGRSNHWASGCYATYHIDGSKLK